MKNISFTIEEEEETINSPTLINQDPPLEFKFKNLNDLDQQPIVNKRYAFFLGNISEYFKEDYEAGPLLFIANGISENKAALSYLINYYNTKKKLPSWFINDITEFRCLELISNVSITSTGNHIEFKIFKDQIIIKEEKHNG